MRWAFFFFFSPYGVWPLTGPITPFLYLVYSGCICVLLSVLSGIGLYAFGIVGLACLGFLRPSVVFRPFRVWHGAHFVGSLVHMDAFFCARRVRALEPLGPLLWPAGLDPLGARAPRLGLSSFSFLRLGGIGGGSHRWGWHFCSPECL